MDRSSKVVLNSINIDPETDYKKKVEIFRNISDFFARPQTWDQMLPLESLYKMTGQPLEACKAIAVANNNMPLRTFDDWYDEYKMRYLDEYQAMNRENLMRNLVVHHYVHEKTIPTLKTMMVYLQRNGHSDITKDKLRQLLKANGFIWQRLPRSSKSILVEDHKQVFERQNYLRNILKYREEGRHIVYVNETIIRQGVLKTIDVSGNYLYCYAVVSPDLGLLDVKVKIVKLPASCQFYQFPSIEPWVLDEIVLTVPEGSVIVWPCRSYHTDSFVQLPDVFSSKKEIMNWLEFRNIPFSSSMHRAEMLDIIERSKHSFTESHLHKLDVEIAAYGHTTLRLPRKLGMISLFEHFWNNFFKKNIVWNKNNKMESLVLETFNKTSITDWKHYNEKLIQKEVSTYEEDKVMEEVIDKILTMARFEELNGDEFDDETPDNWLYNFVSV